MSTHTGTHVDAPLHFDPGGASVDAIPASALVGSARVLRAPKGRGEDVTAAELESLEALSGRLERGSRVLVETRWSSRAARAGARFAYDSYRRFVQMFGDVVLGIPHDRFESRLEELKDARRTEHDTDLSAADWQALLLE